MAGTEEQAELKPIDNEDPEETPGYKAPEKKTIEEIHNLDADDESLVQYKKTLLGGGAFSPADDPRRVVVEKMAFVVEGRDDIELDLTGDLSGKKFDTIVVKEGTEFKIKIYFKVQHEIITGLKYHHALSRNKLTVEKKTYMIGSYGPKEESYTYLSPVDEAPKGMMARAHYKVKSRFVDDDKNEHLAWEWSIDIKKDWKD